MNDERNDPTGAERFDLSALDPGADAARLERLIAQVRVAATPELLRRASLAQSSLESRSPGVGLLDLFLLWRRPILAASAVLAIASTATLMTVRTTSVTEQTTLAESLGVPSDWVSWLRSTEQGAVPSDVTGESP